MAMRGRSGTMTPTEAVRQVFRLTGPLASLPTRHNAAPTRQVSIVQRTPRDGERGLAQAR